MEEIGKQDIRDVELGSSIMIERSILFLDVRGFTAIAEKVIE